MGIPLMSMLYGFIISTLGLPICLAQKASQNVTFMNDNAENKLCLYSFKEIESPPDSRGLKNKFGSRLFDFTLKI